MPVPRFLAANLSSGVIWAAVHVVPAAAAGVLLVTVGAVSGRLLAALVAGLVGYFLRHSLARVPGPARRAVGGRAAIASAVVRLAQSKSTLVRRVAEAADPRNPRLLDAVGWSALFVLAAIGFAGVVEDLVAKEPLVRADTAISQLVQSVRTPLLDRVMVGITEFGDPVVVIVVVATLLASLALARQWRPALVVGSAFILATATVPLIKLILHRQRPIDIYSGAELFSFPSGHSTFATLLFATLALLIAPQFKRRAQIAAWTAALLGVISNRHVTDLSRRPLAFGRHRRRLGRYAYQLPPRTTSCQQSTGRARRLFERRGGCGRVSWLRDCPRTDSRAKRCRSLCSTFKPERHCGIRLAQLGMDRPPGATHRSVWRDRGALVPSICWDAAAVGRPSGRQRMASCRGRNSGAFSKTLVADHDTCIFAAMAAPARWSVASPYPDQGDKRSRSAPRLPALAFNVRRKDAWRQRTAFARLADARVRDASLRHAQRYVRRAGSTTPR